MLSDIGEVTEVESTPGRKLPGPAERRMLKQAQGIPSRSSPAMGPNSAKRMRNGSHVRKYSIESTSTVTSEGKAPVNHFKDFEEGSIVDDSNFQGDDEESVTSYSDEVFAVETQRLAKKESSGDGEDDRNSSAALSRRAEQILLNAKKRLNNMEGNLTRARSSLHITPSGSVSSIHSSSPLSQSTPSPSDSDHRILPHLGTQPSKHRHFRTPYDAQSGSPGHARVYSENAIVPSRLTAFPVRASSAAARYVGRRGSDASQQPSPFPENLDAAQLQNPPHSGFASRTSPPRAMPLEPLSEDEVAGPKEDKEDAKADGDEWQPDANDEHRLTRSASSMQMRDLRDQVQDLKGRLSALRDRARDDSMRRRSLQSLRTPSPFTAAEQWYAGARAATHDARSSNADGINNSSGDEAAIDHHRAPKPVEGGTGAPISVVDEAEYPKSEGTSIYEDVQEIPARREDLQPVREGHSGSDPALDEEAGDREDENDYREEIVERDELDEYESDASLYHDTFDVPLSHEDREDAFDYEHFFLHSAMGTISQAGRRGSVSSFSSEDSVATTRGPPAPDPNGGDRPSLLHRRNESSETLSSVASFATANEDLPSPDDQGHGDYAVQYVATQPRSESPVTAKRSTFGLPGDGRASPQPRSQSSSAVDDAGRGAPTLHRPSVASFDSFESVATARSFPLVNKPKVLHDVRQGAKSASLLSESVTLRGNREHLQPSPVDMLSREDQILVERLVSSLGKCVLGLQEAGRASYEGRMWRRRLDAARRTLEGQEGAV